MKNTNEYLEYEEALNIAMLLFERKEYKEAVDKFEMCVFADESRFSTSLVEYLKEERLFYNGVDSYARSTVWAYSKTPRFIREKENLYYKWVYSFKSSIFRKERVVGKSLILFPDVYVLNFGQYKGKTLSEVLDSNIEYVFWCIENIEWFGVRLADFLKRKKGKGLLYMEALEMLIIKADLLSEWYEEDWNRYVSIAVDWSEPLPTNEQWMRDEFGEDADTASWNMD